jgi:hypothetical protein
MKTILLLEDNDERIAGFKSAVHELGGDWQVRVWRDAPTMLAECEDCFDDDPGEEGAAVRLLKSSKPELLKLTITSLLDCAPKKIWPLIRERLYDEDEDIRKPVCAYAVIKLSPKQLEKTLESYLSRDRYFYNVVFYLDRVLYARLPLRKIFRKEIEKFLS